MKYIVALSIVVMSSLMAQTAEYDPVLAVVIMVKNEESNIVETLQPFVEGGITHYLVYDTGSTDNTMGRIRDYFNEKNITHAVILQGPWEQFAPSRNRALDLALQHFPHAGFFVMPDAEWYIENAADLLQFCKQELESGNPKDHYLISIYNHSTDFRTPRLFKATSNVRFIGRRHEVPPSGTAFQVPKHIRFLWNPSPKGNEKSRERWKTDVEELYKDHMEYPNDGRWVFYLAQTYQLLNDPVKASNFYRLRIQMGGFNEETFMAMYRLGQITESLEGNKEFLWTQAMHYYLQAFTFRPHRAEPLIAIAKHYMIQDNHHLAMLFARRACEIPYPDHDFLFIDKQLYECERYEILSRSAWYVGDFEIGEWAAREALRVHPDWTHLQNNLNFYIDRKKKRFDGPASNPDDASTTAACIEA